MVRELPLIKLKSGINMLCRYRNLSVGVINLSVKLIKATKNDKNRGNNTISHAPSLIDFMLSWGFVPVPRLTLTHTAVPAELNLADSAGFTTTVESTTYKCNMSSIARRASL